MTCPPSAIVSWSVCNNSAAGTDSLFILCFLNSLALVCYYDGKFVNVFLYSPGSIDDQNTSGPAFGR